MEILVNTNKKFEPHFRRWLETINTSIALCVEPVWSEKQSFGAVGSLAYWAKHISDDLLVIASDNYFEFDMCGFLSAYDSMNTLVAVYNFRDRPKACQFGVVQLDGDMITAFDEKPQHPKSSHAAIACYISPPRVFHLVFGFASENGRSNLGDLIAALIAKDNVRAYTFSQFWFNVGTLDSLWGVDSLGFC